MTQETTFSAMSKGVVVATFIVAILSLTTYLLLADCSDGTLIIGGKCKMADNYGEAFSVGMIMSMGLWFVAFVGAAFIYGVYRVVVDAINYFRSETQ